MPFVVWIAGLDFTEYSMAILTLPLNVRLFALEKLCYMALEIVMLS